MSINNSISLYIDGYSYTVRVLLTILWLCLLGTKIMSANTIRSGMQFSECTLLAIVPDVKYDKYAFTDVEKHDCIIQRKELDHICFQNTVSPKFHRFSFV